MGKEMNRPELFLEGKYSEKNIKDFKDQHPNCQLIDIYKQQLKELFEISYPGSDSSSDQYGQFMQVKDAPAKGSWVYFPWSNQLIHILNEPDYFALRTNRNQQLINKDEQQKLQEHTVCILGLSVGNSMAVALAYSAACGKLVLADKDNFSTSNMNRVRVGIADIQQPKLTVTMQQIYEADPYAKLEGYPEGITKDKIAELIKSGKFILFDEIDDFEIKVQVRLEAKNRKIPVVMLTNLGDNILIDIERYDLSSQTRLFNGLIDHVLDDILSGGQISEEDKIRLARQIVGIDHVPTRALESLQNIGVTLVGRPQLYSTVSVAGGLATYIVRKIGLSEDLPSGRYFISFAELFNLPKSDLKMTQQRTKTLGLMKSKK